MADGSSGAGALALSALPTIPRLPIFESLPFMLHREGFNGAVLAWAERFRAHGAFRSVQPGGAELIFVFNAALAEDLCDESRFEKSLDGPLEHIRAFAGDGLFTARSDEEAWHRAHRVLNPGFSTASLERYYPAILENVDALLAHWRRASGPVDVVSDMTRMTLDAISLAGFDYRFASFEKPELHPFLQSLARALQETSDVLQRPPIVAPLFRARRAQHERDIAVMFSLVDEVIRARKALDPARWPRDFLSLMLAERDPKSGEKLSDENIRYQIVTFLIAGHETTAGLLSFALHALARDRGLFARVRREVDAKLGDTAAPSMKAVLELDLVKRVLSETLRLWPTVPAISRAAKQDTLLGGRYLVPRGRSIWLQIGALHRDGAVWPQPERFDPDRFLPENVKARPSSAYKPFGVGRRVCTGRHFAMIEASLTLALIVRAFDFEDPGPLAISPTLSPKPARFRLQLRPRARAA